MHAIKPVSSRDKHLRRQQEHIFVRVWENIGSPFLFPPATAVCLDLLAVRCETPELETEDFTTHGSSSSYGDISPQFSKPNSHMMEWKPS